MAHFVYLLSNKYGKQYVGHTEDINARLIEHNEGSVKATKNLRPWEVEWFCGFRNKSIAIRFEKYLKSGSGRSFRDRHLI
ncbi:MAG: GIY-YIG nuclease family protein [Candidatus Pacebacteria bacterium]|nr:GIY-YIG nuclease family protein [Candidatus Paceibacterota bacterium]HCI03744.1 excinuclease ABC subunit C [Candidatus Peribacteria bacterium]